MEAPAVATAVGGGSSSRPLDPNNSYIVALGINRRSGDLVKPNGDFRLNSTDVKDASSFQGEPALYYSSEELEKSSDPLRSGQEPSLVPVWVNLSGLLLNLFNPKDLSSIGSSLGRVLQFLWMGPPRNISRPSLARICVEIDVSKYKIHRFRKNVMDEEDEIENLVTGGISNPIDLDPVLEKNDNYSNLNLAATTSVCESSTKSWPLLLFVGLLFLVLLFAPPADQLKISMASSLPTRRLLADSSTTSQSTMNLNHQQTKNSSVSTSKQFEAENTKPRAAETTNKKVTANKSGNGNIAARTFTFCELASATKNFRQECLVGEGGFGRVYKGRLENNGQVVAVKQLDRNGLQGNREFLVEVLILSLLHHENLVNLIGYCADGEQRLLVYEYMPLGSVEDHLLDISPDQKPLGWFTRMKIASGAARGLEYLHDTANPPAQPIFKDPKRFQEMADPLLQGDFPVRGLNQAVAIAAMCLQEEAMVRPLISDVVTALSFLSIVPDKAPSVPLPLPSPLAEEKIWSDYYDHRHEDSPEERQRAVAEAMEWGSNSRKNNRRSQGRGCSSL
ncbi:hypothetical protein HHK36_020343 [Tetracentron sinense]|uniref:Protein kinase domain-containing protein n=1 Tax=Tetracentron sinense TaxID=13715 RepID=A0A834YTK4_TETSI|nr:hypothetical protein HHK36_020343 [Tetracentron sinense]